MTKMDLIVVFGSLLTLVPTSKGCFDTSDFDICHSYEVRTDEKSLTVTASTGATVNTTGGVSNDVPGTDTTAIYRHKEGVPFRLDVIEFAWENAEKLVFRYVLLKQPYHEFVKEYPLSKSPYQIYLGYQEHNPITELVVTASPKNISIHTSFRLVDLCACKNGPPAACTEDQKPMNLSDFDVLLNFSLPFLNETINPKMINARELAENTYASKNKDTAFFSVDFVLKTKEVFIPVLMLFRLAHVKMLHFGWYEREEDGEWRWDWWAFDKIDRDFTLTRDAADRADWKRAKAVRVVAESKKTGTHFGFALDRLDVCIPPPQRSTTSTPTTPPSPTTTSTTATPTITDVVPAPGERVPLPLNFLNPCKKLTAATGRFYFPHPRRAELFIQCDIEGNGYVVACASGLVFFQAASVCVHQG